MKYHYFNCYVIICVLILFLTCNKLRAQGNDKFRFNLELSTGLSSFKETNINSPSVAGNLGLSLWTPSENIFSFETFFTGYTDYMIDYSVLYGRMLFFEQERKSFISLHGGMGYVKIINQKDEFEIIDRTFGLTAQIKSGWAFDKGWIGIMLYQKYSFMKGNNIRGVNLIFSLNLSRALPK